VLTQMRHRVFPCFLGFYPHSIQTLSLPLKNYNIISVECHIKVHIIVWLF
jgi:hypothetical protein